MAGCRGRSGTFTPRLDSNGPILDERREVLDRHRSDRRLGGHSSMIATGSHGEADLETRHGTDANESPLDRLRPRRSLGCEMQPADRRLSISQIVVTTRRRT